MSVIDNYKYDPETGILMGPSGKELVSDKVTINPFARVKKTHLIWKIMTGEWPRSLVDHRDRNPLNNKWSNLRQATPQQNSMNRDKPNYRCGLAGVHKVSGGFQARITIGRKRVHLGFFKTAQEAHEVYVQARIEHFGEFA